MKAAPAPCQLGLMLGRDEDDLRRHIEREAKRPVVLVMTENSSSLLSLRADGPRLRMRLHRMFLLAGDDVIVEIARFARRGRGKTPLFHRFVREHGHLIGERPPRRRRPRPSGRRHDLGPIFDALNRRYFGGSLACPVTWGGRAKKRVRNRTLGSYSPRTDTIRISPVLDSGSVPGYYVSFVLYHEMLHASMHAEGGGTGHTAEFRRRERLYAHYERASAWERTRYPRGGRRCGGPTATAGGLRNGPET